jgi:membrane fusion protein (multidrug efflux system)
VILRTLSCSLLLVAMMPGSETAPAAKPEVTTAAEAKPSATWISAKRDTVRVTVGAVGTLRARQVSVLGAQVSGRVAEVLVEVGSVVAEKQELVRLDPVFFRLAVESRTAEVDNAKARCTTLDAALNAAKAQVEAAEAETADAKLNLERMRALWEKPDGSEPSIPKRMYDEAVTRDRTTRARLEAANAGIQEVRARMIEAGNGVLLAEVGLRRAQQDLAESVIRAPYAGVITRRLVDPGASATSAPVTDVLEIQEVARLYLECSVPQELLSGLGTQTRLQFTVDGAPGNYDATVSTVFPAIDAATRNIRLRAEVDNAAGRLRPGSLAQVQVVLKEIPDAVVVPRSALKQTAAGWVVVGRKGEIPVKIGVIDGDRVQIIDGLSAGDDVQSP